MIQISFNNDVGFQSILSLTMYNEHITLPNQEVKKNRHRTNKPKTTVAFLLAFLFLFLLLYASILFFSQKSASF